MTTWDSIYKNYQKGGPAWATLSEGVDPYFIKFVQTTDFPERSALDIGCGTGRYLAYLQGLNFKVAGIDSSQTAVEMTQKLLGQKESSIEVADMYSFIIPEKYDFIFSLSTIHHGRKTEVQKIIQHIHEKLLPGGSVLITLPDLESSKLWETFKDNQEIEPGTYAPLSGPEKGLAHSFFTEEEIQKIFLPFSQVSSTLDKVGRWYITGQK